MDYWLMVYLNQFNFSRLVIWINLLIITPYTQLILRHTVAGKNYNQKEKNVFLYLKRTPTHANTHTFKEVCIDDKETEVTQTRYSTV